MNNRLVLLGLLICVLVAFPVVMALGAPSQLELTTGALVPNASLVAVLLAVPALYLLGGPFDPRQ